MIAVNGHQCYLVTNVRAKKVRRVLEGHDGHQDKSMMKQQNFMIFGTVF